MKYFSDVKHMNLGPWTRGMKRAATRRLTVHARRYTWRTGPSGQRTGLRVIKPRASRRAWHRLIVRHTREGA